jgi:hypothetical protein
VFILAFVKPMTINKSRSIPPAIDRAMIQVGTDLSDTLIVGVNAVTTWV